MGNESNQLQFESDKRPDIYPVIPEQRKWSPNPTLLDSNKQPTKNPEINLSKFDPEVNSVYNN